MIEPDRRIAADWLALRRRADLGARHLARRLVDEVLDLGPVTAVDFGAGTGANHAYLAPLMPGTTWILLDHDSALLADASPYVTRVVGGVELLPSIVASARMPLLLTAAAVLDLLDAAQLAAFAEALARPGVVGLFALTVDGMITLDPPHSQDAAVADAFNAHQRREGLAGPDAAAHLAQLCRDKGLPVEEMATPWRLGPSDRPLVERLLRERVAAASEQEPTKAADFAGWLRARERQLAAGTLRVEIGHVDLLVGGIPAN